jgi:hypothetical protein
MKKIIILQICFFFALTAKSFAQDPTVTVNCLSTGCFNPDPETLVQYVAVITNGSFSGGNGWTRQILWEPSASAAFNTSGQGTEFFNLNWINSVNSPQKKIKVTVTYTKPNNPTKVVSNERVVTVKFLSPFTSLIFTGNVSQTNPANNGTITIPCNAGNITLAANQTAPITDPPATVAFTWTLPNGVTQTSSTGNITFNGSGTTDGAIIVTAKRMDGNFMQTFTVNFVRNRVTTPVIASLNNISLICQGSNQLFGATSTNATSFNWTVSGSAGLVGQSGALASYSANSNGTGIITVTADNACNAPKSQSRQVTTGTPVFLSTLVNGNPSSGFNIINNPAQLNVVVSNSHPSTGFNWTKPNGNGSIYPNYGGSNVSFNGTSYGYTGTCTAYANNFVVVKAEAANTCGVGQSYFYYLQLQGTMFRMASPNPAQNQISVELSKETPPEMLKSITVVSDQQSTVSRVYSQGGASDKFSKRLDNVVNFDVSSLPRGKYFVVLVFVGDKKYTEQVVLN